MRLWRLSGRAFARAERALERGVLPAGGTGQQQRARRLRVRRAQREPGVEQQVEVLARLERAGVEEVAVGGVEPGARGPDLVGRRGAPRRVDAVPDHLDLAGRGGEGGDQVARGRVGDRDEPSRRRLNERR